MYLVALTHVDNRQQTVVQQGVANHSMAREAWGQRIVVAWAERYDFYSSRRRRRLVRASSSDD